MNKSNSEIINEKMNEVPLCLKDASLNFSTNDDFTLAEKEQLSLAPKSNLDEEIKIEGDVVIRFQPKPRLIIKTNADFTDSFDYFSQDKTLKISFENLEFYCRMTNLSSDNSGNHETILSSVDDRIHQKEVEDIKCVTFYLVNFPFCFGKSIRGRNKSNFFWRGRLELEDHDWRITIDKMENHKNLQEKLKQKDGFAITHAGKIEKKNSQEFTSKELELLNKKLFEFLSFSRGARAAPIFFHGYNKNNKNIWKDWSFLRVDSWSLTQNNWFCEQHSFKQLDELFPSWSKLLEHELWQIEIPKIRYWYCYAGRNTEGAGTDGSLILAIAALELLSFNYLVRYRELFDAENFKQNHLHNSIYKTLNDLKIPTDLSKDLTNLFPYAMQKQKNWQNGPKAIVEVRNEIVHPDRDGAPGSWVCYDALELSLWYIEMIFLRLCKYEGDYSNRLDKPKWKGEVEPVPWAITN